MEMDLEGFEAYLKERRLAWERQRPYLVRWVRKFLSGAGARPDLAPSDQKRLFEETLRRDRRLDEWQVRQALDAVDLYLDQYLPWARSGKRIKDSPDDFKKEEAGTELEARTPGDWNSNLERTREILRLRHYSYRTERSYIHWVERFHGFCQSRKLDPGSTDSVRSFLSYLALRRNVASSTQNQAFNALLFYFRE